MFYIIETDTQLERLQSLGRLGGFVDIVPTNYYYHPKLTSTVAVYLRPINSKHGFIIPIDHSDGLNTEKIIVDKVISKFTDFYVWDKKEFLYHFIQQSANDIQLLYLLNSNKRLDIRYDSGLHSYYYNKFNGKKNINNLIPLSKHIERAEKRYEEVKKVLNLPKDESYNFYNKIATTVFFMFEQSGLSIHEENFVKLFKPKVPEYNIEDRIAYTYFNPYNITSRPTNSFNSVNFSAIPHKKEYRDCFIPKNDRFVEFDFDGYHIRILADQLGYKLTKESAHKQLAKMYIDKDIISEEEYKQVKQTNFQALYGQIPEKYKDVEFFKLIQEYIDKLWEEFTGSGKVICPISNRVFKIDMDTPQKLMNYVMQNLETSYNILIFKNLLRYLKDKKSDVVLYTYDSVVLDFSEEDNINTIKEIKEILENNGLLPVNIKHSQNLNFN